MRPAPFFNFQIWPASAHGFLTPTLNLLESIFSKKISDTETEKANKKTFNLFQSSHFVAFVEKVQQVCFLSDVKCQSSNIFCEYKKISIGQQ